MATKQEMIQDIFEFYNKNELLFQQCNIRRLTFFRWVDSLENDWNICRKANSYIFTKLSKILDNMRLTWSIMPPLAWKSMILINHNAREVLELKDKIMYVLDCWKQRPIAGKGSQ